MKNKKQTLIDFALLALVTVITYFPISSFLFSLKNDSLVQYLPFRYHLSESIQYGHFPLWNPYLYTGFPIHADMQGMTWNPIVLLISLFTKYNMSILELEVTIYLVCSAIGMYLLLKSFSLRRSICLVGAVSYMACGFINGSASVIPWISSAAFIPFVFRYLKLFLEQRNLKSGIYFSIALSFLFLCGYPTFFIYTCYIIFAIILYAILANLDKRKEFLTKNTIGFFAVSILLFLLICSPAIVSYWDFLPYYSRGSGISSARAGQNPFTIYSSLSFLLPNAVHKEHVWLNTDASMRNSYVGLFVFLLFVASLFYKKNKWQKFFLGITVFSFVLSLGSTTPLHQVCYKILPLFNTFRHPGNIRLFTSIGIILLAAIFFQYWLSSTVKPDKIIKNILLSTGGFLLLVALYGAFQPAVFKNLSESFSRLNDPKAFLDGLRFPTFLFIQALIQTGFIIALLVLVNRKFFNKKLVSVLFVLNVIVFCWMALPFTFISQLKTSTVNRFVSSFPDGYPYPDVNASVEADINSDSTNMPIEGYPNFYSKRITIQDHIITPTVNTDYERFYSNLKLRKWMADYPLAWLNDTIYTVVPDTVAAGKKFSIWEGKRIYKKIDTTKTTGTIKLTGFGPNHFRFDVHTNNFTELSLFQQYNHNWEARVNGQRAPIYRMNLAFMGISLPKGDSKVELVYRPTAVIYAAWISLATILLIGLFFLTRSTRKKTQHD